MPAVDRSWTVSSYLGASSNGDDTSQEISYHRFQRDIEAIHVDSVDQTQTVLFNQAGEDMGQTRLMTSFQ